MEAIKKQRTKIEEYYEYKAIDGTVFDNADECRKYDESARAVLYSKYNKLVVQESCEYNIINIGSEDNCMDIVKLNGKEDADLLKQVFFFEDPHYKNDKDLPDWIKRDFDIIDEASKNDDVVFVGRGYNGNEFWIIGSCKSLCEKINKFKNIKKEEEEK